MIPRCPGTEDLDAVSVFIEFCIGFPASQKQYNAVKQYLMLFFEAASHNADEAIFLQLYRATQMASMLANNNRDDDMQVKWRLLSEESKEAALKTLKGSMPHLFQEIMKALHKSMESMQNLAEARSILDRGLLPIADKESESKSTEDIEEQIRQLVSEGKMEEALELSRKRQ